jgi:DNA (cytosine-5)-methyltransferase 1
MARAFKSQPGQHETSVLEVVLDELRGLGYKAGFFVANALDAGVPQNRKRVITFGVTEGLVGDLDPGLLLEAQYKLAGYNQRVQLGLPTDRYTTIGEAIHDLAGDELVVCPDSQEFQSSKYLPAKSQYAKLMRRGKRTGSIPNSHRFSQHGEKVLSLYETALATQSPGRLSKQFLLDNKTKTKKKFLLGEDICASTLTTHPDEHIHYLYPRNVSLREMARIQSFPDDFYFYGRYTLNGDRRKLDVSRCAQIGNAIAPLMASALGIAVRESYELLVATDRGERLKKLKESTAIGETVPLFL